MNNGGAAGGAEYQGCLLCTPRNLKPLIAAWSPARLYISEIMDWNKKIGHPDTR